MCGTQEKLRYVLHNMNKRVKGDIKGLLWKRFVIFYLQLQYT